MSSTNSEREVFTYEDFLALSDEERRRIDAEIDAMSNEEQFTLGDKIVDFMRYTDLLDRSLKFYGD